MLKRLIDKQTIQIDAHQRGSKNIISWDNQADDIHVHKRMHTKVANKALQADIRIPINSDRPVTIKVSGKGNVRNNVASTAEEHLKGEIREALSNKRMRQEFVDDLLKELDNYQSTLSSVERARAAVKRLARHFNLPENVETELTTYAESRLINYTSLFVDRQSRQYFISLSVDQIRVGEVNPYSNYRVKLKR